MSNVQLVSLMKWAFLWDDLLFGLPRQWDADYPESLYTSHLTSAKLQFFPQSNRTHKKRKPKNCPRFCFSGGLGSRLRGFGVILRGTQRLLSTTEATKTRAKRARTRGQAARPKSPRGFSALARFYLLCAPNQNRRATQANRCPRKSLVTQQREHTTFSSTLGLGSVSMACVSIINLK